MNKVAPILLAIVAITAGVFFARMQPANDVIEISGFAFPSPKPLENVELINQENTRFTAEQFRDKWTFIYVGYTFCPDACPMTMVTLDQIHNALEDSGDLTDDISMMLVSVDPDRDTPERLKSYVAHFNERFTGASGTEENLRNFAGQVSAVYSLPEDRSDPNYLVDHSSTIILIDPNAAVHAVFTPPQEADKLADDFRQLRKRFS